MMTRVVAGEAARRSMVTEPLRKSHQVSDPKKNPETMTRGVLPLLHVVSAARLENIAVKDRIVMGLASVRRHVVPQMRKTPSWVA